MKIDLNEDEEEEQKKDAIQAVMDLPDDINATQALNEANKKTPID